MSYPPQTSSPYGPGSDTPPQDPYASPVRPTSGRAVAAMICGLAGLIPCFLAVPSVVAVFLGHAALRETANGARPGHGPAVTGLILGYVVTGLAFLCIVLLIVRSGGSLLPDQS